jgi:hypothetical protein
MGRTITRKLDKGEAEQWVDKVKAPGKGRDIGDIIKEFVKKNGDKPDFVRSFAVALAKENKKSWLFDEDMGYAVWNLMVTLIAADKTNVMDVLGKITDTTSKGDKFNVDVGLLMMDLLSDKKKEYDSIMAKIRKGEVDFSAFAVCIHEMQKDYVGSSGKEALKYEKIFGDIAYNLALLHADLEKQLAKQKREAEFGKMKAE